MRNRSLFSPAERQQILDTLLAALQSDPRIGGVLIVGSGATGFRDAFSDIDLSVVVADTDAAQDVFREWKARLHDLLPIVHCFEVTYTPHDYLVGCLLANFLEVDIGFVGLAELVAKRANWRVAFDRLGDLEARMQSSWENRNEPDVKTRYRECVDSIWYYITHGVVCLRRGENWRALHHLDVVRNRAIELAGLRCKLETRRFRQVDRLPPAFLAKIQRTLVSSVEAAAILRALQIAADCFFREAQAIEQTLGLNLARPLEAEMQKYLSRIKAGNQKKR